MTNVIRYGTLYSVPKELVILFYGNSESASTLDQLLVKISKSLSKNYFGKKSTKFEISRFQVPDEIRSELPKGAEIMAYFADLENLIIHGLIDNREHTYETLTAELNTKVPRHIPEMDLRDFLPVTFESGTSGRLIEHYLQERRDSFESDFSNCRELREDEILRYLKALIYYANNSVPPNVYVSSRNKPKLKIN